MMETYTDVAFCRATFSTYQYAKIRTVTILEYPHVNDTIQLPRDHERNINDMTRLSIAWQHSM
jgi:hypothetical protein